MLNKFKAKLELAHICLSFKLTKVPSSQQ